MRLEGKVAIVSGGSRGQGEAEARLFAKEGAGVVIGDVLVELGDAVASEINDSGGRALFVRLDVTSEADWQELIATTVQRFGKLNILVNNAGIARPNPLMETSEELWDEVMSVNSTGVFLGTKYAIPEMRKAGGGSIINTASTAGLIGGPAAAYHASKGSVRIFTRAIAVAHAKEGIRANSIYPGAVDTPMSSYGTSTPEEQAATRARVPLGRVGLPIDIAYGALFLASDESSYMTGAELVIDGGHTAH